MPKQLPSSPNLEQLKKQAKDLLKAYRSGAQNARERFIEYHPRFLKPDTALADAQLVIAREYGFTSWAGLKLHIESNSASIIDELLAQNAGMSATRTFGRFPTLGEMKEYYARDDVLSFLYDECQMRNIDIALRSKRWAIEPASKSHLREIIEKTTKERIEPGYRKIAEAIDSVRLKECEYLSFHSRTSITSGERLKGFDVIFESDPSGWRQAFEDLYGVIVLLNEFEVHYRIKFSGVRSLHFMIPFEAFPGQFNGESILSQRENIQRKLGSYFRQYCGMRDAHGGAVLRLAYSLNEDNGLVSLPVSFDELSAFRPWESIMYNVTVDKPWHGDAPTDSGKNMLKLLRHIYSDDKELGKRDSRWISHSMETVQTDRSVYAARPGGFSVEEWAARLKSSSESEKVEAAWNLMTTPEAVPLSVVERNLDAKNPDVRWYLTEALQKNMNGDSLNLARKMLRDDDQLIRASAVDALVLFGEDALDVMLSSASIHEVLSMESLNDMTYAIQKLWQGLEPEKMQSLAAPINNAVASLILGYVDSGRDYWLLSGYIQTFRNLYSQYCTLEIFLFHDTIRQLFPKLLRDMQSVKADYRLYVVVLTDLRKELTLPLMIIGEIARSLGMDNDGILPDPAKIEDLEFLEPVISDFVAGMSWEYEARILVAFMLYGKRRLIQPAAEVLMRIGASAAVDAMAYMFLKGVHPNRFMKVKTVLEQMESSVMGLFRENVSVTDEAWKLISGQATVSELVEALEAGRRIRTCAAAALTQMGDEAVSELKRTLDSDDKQARSSAMYALGRIGKHSPSAISVLMEALLHKSKPTREQATKALKYIGQPAVPTLLEMLRKGQDKLRSNVALVLGRIEDQSAVPGLMEALIDESGPVRLNAAKALGTIGDSIAIPALTKALDDEQEWVRRQVALSLENIETSEA